jgi:hypothetical protein
MPMLEPTSISDLPNIPAVCTIFPENLLVASTPVSQLGSILVPLFSISESSHVRGVH